MDDLFTEHLQYNELLGLSNNIENEQHWSDSAETKTIQHWSDSEIKTLLSYLSDNFDCYRTNKTKFYAKAAIKIGNNRIGVQIRSKLQALIARFEEENREKTGKGRSEWPYFDDMNEIFGNRENVYSDYFVSNIDIDKPVINTGNNKYKRENFPKLINVIYQYLVHFMKQKKRAIEVE
ncbi:unnamed protein product [Rhizophagus irregularis]|nr:unnamed protein product [Rhizophagus irregularis]